MMHDLNDMMVFLTVVEAGSFTHAAERLAMPKANVSRKVARLEQQLGIILLERSTRSQHLTEAGKRYYTRCKRIAEEMDLAHSELHTINHCVKGKLKIGASVTLGQQILKPSLSHFILAYPEIELQLSLTNQRVDLIEHGFDILIRVGELDDSRLVAKKLTGIKRAFYARPNYFTSTKQLVETPAELPAHQLLLMSPDNRVRSITLTSQEGDKTNLVLTPSILSDDFAVLKQLAIDGCGIALLPSYMATDAIDNGQLIPVLPQWQTEVLPLNALYPKHRTNIAKVAAFLTHLETVFKQPL